MTIPHTPHTLIATMWHNRIFLPVYTVPTLARTAFIVLSSLLYCHTASATEAYWYTNQKKLNTIKGNASYEEEDIFMLGRSFFIIPWVEAPSATTARDGLGPLFNANTCASCHNGNGPGEIFNKEGQLSRAVVTKLSRKSGLPVPFYGKQVAVNGTRSIPFEAIPTRTYTDISMNYPDGSSVTLQKPEYHLTHLNYGSLPDDVIVVQRRATSLIGLGPLSKVTDATILEHADPDDLNNDGISGKPNWVINAIGQRRLGRYTAKASVATVTEQTADAAINDMGLTNPIFPEENCTPEQTECLAAPHGRPDHQGVTIDLTQQRLEAITYFLKHTRIPKVSLDTQGQYGKALFTEIGCASCHLPSMKTSTGMELTPYTDLLLHDIGEGLADGRKEFDATGREFRTAPLWGIATHKKTLVSKKPHYLHDGRARSLEEAILWHGGEAQKAKEIFMQLSKDDREALLSFLNQL